MKPILIISGNGDAHAEHMHKILIAKAVPHFVFPTDKYPYDTDITFDFDKGYTLGYDGVKINLTEDWSIWNRRIFPITFPEGFPKNLEEMVIEESKRTLYGLMVTHRGLIVNNPFDNHRVNNKVEQLQRARSIGLAVPDTIITNDPDQAKSFFEKHKGDVIFKMQKLPIIQEEDQTARTIMTNRVQLEQFYANLERIRNNPCCFQKRIDKAYEIRLTIIGERLFPIAIYSQSSDVSKDDFRRYDFKNVKYRLVNIPEDVTNKVLELTRRYHLHYAAIDLICTPQGEHVFLEVNPNGQYLWTEEMSGVPITEAFVDYLTNAKPRRFES